MGERINKTRGRYIVYNCIYVYRRCEVDDTRKEP